MIYATNAIESYNSALRKYAKNKRSSSVTRPWQNSFTLDVRAMMWILKRCQEGAPSAAHGCVAHMSGTDDQAVSVRTQFGNELPKIIRQSRFASS